MPRLHVHRITSIGAVESGDNPEAEILFWKRAVSTDERERLAAKGQALPDGSFPIANAVDLRNAIASFGRAKNKRKVRKHIIKRARALGRINALPDSWNVKKANLTELVNDVHKAWSAANPTHDGGVHSWVRTVHDDFVIVEIGDDQFKVQYTRDVSGDITFGERLEVEVVETIVPVTKTANPSEGRTNGGGPVDTLDLSSLDDETAEPILAFVAGLQKAATEADEKIAALEADVEDEDDPLIDLPEPVAKALAERDEQIAKAEAKAATAEEAVAKLQDERLTERYTERAEKLSNMLGKPAEVAPVLKDLAKAAPEAFAKLDSMFDTLLTWDGMADLLKEHGDNAATGSAADTLTALATDIQKEKPDMSMADARVEAHHQRPELRELMREEGS